MHGAEPALRLAAMPNAGLPYRAGERMVYPSAPHYFAERVPQFLAAGRVAGGRLLRHDARAHPGDACGAGRSGAAAERRMRPVPLTVPMPDGAGLLAGLRRRREDAAPAPTGLLQKLRAGKFVVSVEVDPPRGFNAAKMLEGAAHGAGARRRRGQRGRQPDGARAHGRAGAVRADPAAGGHRDDPALHHPRPLADGPPGRPDRRPRAGRAQHHRAHRRPAQPGRPAGQHRGLRRGFDRPGAHHRPVQPRLGPGGQAVRRPLGVHDRRGQRSRPAPTWRRRWIASIARSPAARI